MDTPFSPTNVNTPSEFGKPSSLARANAARALKRSQPVTIKTDYLDDDGWIELAAAHGWHLPQKKTRASSAGIAPWLIRLGLDKPKFRAWCGYSPAEWCVHNPTWSLRGLVGLLLEDFAPDAGREP